MTLKTRNRLFKIFFLFSIAVVVFSAVIFIASIIMHKPISTTSVRVPEFLSKIPFISISLPAVMLSFAVIALYVILTTATIIVFFENTQCSEVIFFTAFLLGCICELMRLFIICFGLGQTFSNTLIFAGNVVLFGRVTAILSFVAASILSETDQRQDIERNYLIIIALSLIVSILMPMNTAKISSTGLVGEGFMKTLTTIKILLVVLNVLSFLIRGVNHSSNEYKRLAVFYIMLFTGYIFLIFTDNILFLVTGTALLFSGTTLYLKNLHSLYLWS